MGTSTSPQQLGAKFDRLARELRDSKGALNKTGMAGKRIFVAAAGPVIGGRIAGRRKAIGARYDVRGHTVTITYTGPAHLLNNPTRPHRIEPRRVRALTIGGNVRAWANHPGTRGKGFFQKARTVAVRTLPNVFAKAQVTEPLRKIF